MKQSHINRLVKAEHYLTRAVFGEPGEKLPGRTLAALARVQLQMLEHPGFTCTKKRALIKDERMAAKEYRKLGFPRLSRDEARHARVLRRSKCSPLTQMRTLAVRGSNSHLLRGRALKVKRK